ncbi:MAG: hypothetical protein AAB426_14480 [Myxococcota bacterium]
MNRTWSATWGVLVMVIGATSRGESNASEEMRASAVATPAPARSSLFESELDVPDHEKPGRSREAIARMREILTRVIKMLEEAREERDVVKLNCINEKLTSIKGLLRIAEQSDVLLQEALARRDTEISSHEFEKIMIANQKCGQLATESEGCVGELAVYAGDTEVEVVIEDMPEGDSSDNMGGVPIITRPPAASPYQ